MFGNDGIDEATIIGLIVWGLLALFTLRAILSRTLKCGLGLLLSIGGLALLRQTDPFPDPEQVISPGAILYGSILAGVILILGSFTHRSPRVH